MFPKINLDITKEEVQENRSKENQGITYLYDFKKEDFILKNGRLVEAEGKEGVKVWIEKMLLTDEYTFNIYKEYEGDEYGTTIRKLILGKKIPRLLLHSELKRIIEEKTKQNIEIERIEDFKIEQRMATLIIYFTVILIDGESFRQEVSF